MSENINDKIKMYEQKIKELEQQKQQLEVEKQVLEKEIENAKEKLKELGIDVDSQNIDEIINKITTSISDLEAKLESTIGGEEQQ